MLKRPLLRWRNCLRANTTLILGSLIVFITVCSFSVSLQYRYGWNASTTVFDLNGSIQIQIPTSPLLQESTRYRKDLLCSECRFVHLSSTNATDATCQVLFSIEMQTKQNPEQAAGIVQKAFPQVCGRCSYDVCPTNPTAVTCQLLISVERRRNTQLTLLEAAQIVATTYPETCGRCDPKACPDHEKIYWRLDEAAPAEQSARTHYLQSIPRHHRIPPRRLGNLEKYAANDKNIHPNKIHLFEFNPSIVQLPASQIPADLSTAAYLASFRVSFAYNCIQDEKVHLRLIGGSRPRPYYPNFLGMALLDQDLNILRESVMDGQEVLPEFEDIRLFVLQDQIYIASYEKILPLWIVPPPTALVTTDSMETKVLAHVWPNAHANQSDYSLQVTFRTMPSCSQDIHIQSNAKNLNYFVDAHNRTILEMNPMGCKEIMDLQAPCTTLEPGNVSSNVFVPRNSTLPRPSFSTMDELHFAADKIKLPYTEDRGSACCVSVQHPTDGRELLLGIAHRKTNHRPRANHFLSIFYVMESSAPYRVVARTGYFCLGFPQPNERGGNPYLQMMRMDTLQMGENYTNCPRIHFVSSMVKSVKDPSQLIIAYGVEDCVPRMVIVKLADVMLRLFAPRKVLEAWNTVD